MLRQRSAQRGRALQVIGNGMDLVGIQRGQPGVLADQHMTWLRRQLLRQGGFAGTDLAAHQVQGRRIVGR